jgi:predicted DNA-binding transcriptional regulator YafY
MASTSSRTLRLLSLLQSHRYWPGDELADRLGVSLRTLRRDVERLRELGYPVDARRGVDGGYQLAAGATLPPLAVDADEAVALAVGLLGAAHSGVAGMAEASVRALAKVVQVMPKSLRRRVDAVRAMAAGESHPLGGLDASGSVDAGVLTVLAQACRDTERVRFRHTAASGIGSDRLVEPLRVVPTGRRWYLVGYDLDRADWRTFRLDRIEAPRPTGTAFAPRRLPAPDAASFVADSLARAPRPHAVRATVDLPAQDVRARIGRWAQVDPIDQATSSVIVNADGLEWVVMAFVVLDAGFRVEGPPEAVRYLRAWADRFDRATRPDRARRAHPATRADDATGADGRESGRG